MHALGISTTRSLAVVGTGAVVHRQQTEPGAVLTRIAKSHIRVGTFEYAARFGTLQDVEALLQYTVQRHYPELQIEKNVAAAFLQTIIETQMQLIVQWMRVGFIHGVMNTDNMSISAQTIDYGPCAFMNAYNPATVYSLIDTNGRYAFVQQAPIAHWNLVRFAETLLPLLHTNQKEAIDVATEILNTANTIFENAYLKMMHAKIGLQHITTESKIYIEKLLQWMLQNKADYTNTFLQLMGKSILLDVLYTTEDWNILKQEWQNVLAANNISIAQALQIMQAQNPNYIPRNTNIDALIQDCVQTGNTAAIENFIQQMQNTYAVDIKNKELCNYLPENGFSTHCNT
jgi:uncharacterized protein YdiU (UPF0061 family)